MTTLEEKLEKGREYSRKWQRDHPEQSLERNRKYRQAHPERVRESNRKATRKYKQANLEKVRACDRRYQRENLDKRNAIEARRRAAKKQATPPWSLKGFHKERIDEFYEDSALFKWAFKLPFEVDHIVSLFNGGLHVFWNLQHLVQPVNASKSTSDADFEYPEESYESTEHRKQKPRTLFDKLFHIHI